MIYLFFVILLLLLSIHYDINGNKMYQKEWYFIVLVAFVLLAGLRWRICMDTPAYIDHFYDEYPDLSHFSWDDYPIGKDPFYVLINSIVKSLGGRFYIVQLVQALFVNILIFGYLKRHCRYFFTALLFYALTCYIGFSMEIMRAAISIVLVLYANDYILEKKWIKAYLLILIGCMFHAQTIIFLFLPILYFLRFNKIGLIAIVGSFVLGSFLQVVLSDYLFLLEDDGGGISDKVEVYVGSDQFGRRGGNLNFLIVNVFPFLVYGVSSLLFLKKKFPHMNLMKLEPFVVLGFIFLMVQINFQIAYRYVDYFRIYFLIFMSETFVIWVLNSKKLNKSVAFVRTLVFFIPFFFLCNFFFITHYECIIPYSSVIEKSINERRELFYNSTNRSKADINKY